MGYMGYLNSNSDNDVVYLEDVLKDQYVYPRFYLCSNDYQNREKYPQMRRE